MELDQWKDIWKTEGEQPSKDAQKLRSLLDKKSKSPVAKMKRNLKVELWFIIITYGAMILFYFLAFKGKYERGLLVHVVHRASLCGILSKKKQAADRNGMPELRGKKQPAKTDNHVGKIYPLLPFGRNGSCARQPRILCMAFLCEGPHECQ